MLIAFCLLGRSLLPALQPQTRIFQILPLNSHCTPGNHGFDGAGNYASVFAEVNLCHGEVLFPANG